MHKPSFRLVIWFVISSLILLAGCQNSGGNTASSQAANTSETDKQGGELTFAISVPVVNELLDPHRAASPGNSRIQRSVFDSLVVELPDKTFGPWLATKWEISEDEKSYTFELRKDVTFHDGTPFNAEAVKFNFDRIKNLDAPGLSLSYLGSYESTEVIDEYTVKVNFSKPFSPFLRTLSTEHLGMVSPTAVEKLGDKFTQNPVGTGPFKIVGSTPGTEYILAKNPGYNWAPETAKHEGTAYLDRITIKIITEDSTRVNAIQSGDVDAVDTIPPQNIAIFEKNPIYQLKEVEMLNYNAAIHFNAQKAPLNSLEVREALRLAIDWDSIVDTIYLGTYDRAYSTFSPSMFGYDDSLKSKWKTDPKQADKILDDLGWVRGSDGIRVKDGERLTIDMIDFYANREKRMDVMTMVQNQWKKIGVELKINTIPIGDYQEKFKAGNYHLWIGSQISADPDAALRLPLVAKTGYFDPYKDQKLIDLLNQGTEELDVAKRADIYKKIQNHLFDQAYTIPVYVLPYTVAAKSSVHDLSFDTKGFPQFYDVWVEEK